jgi:hypothetical protein
VHHNDRKVTRGPRSANGVIGPRVPTAVIKAKSAPYLTRGQPEGRPQLINNDDHTIVNTSGRVPGHRPVLPAGQDVIGSTGCTGSGDLAAETLGDQTPLVGVEDPRKYKVTVDTLHGPRRCLEPESNAAAGSHWWRGSTAFRYDGRGTRSSPTAPRPRHHPPLGVGNPTPG